MLDVNHKLGLCSCLQSSTFATLHFTEYKEIGYAKKGHLEVFVVMVSVKLNLDFSTCFPHWVVCLLCFVTVCIMGENVLSNFLRRQVVGGRSQCL